MIASALVNTLTTGRTSYTKALLPIAPKIPPTAKLILESRSLSGIRKTKQDIKNDNKPPVKILKNKTRPPLFTFNSNISDWRTCGLIISGAVLILSVLISLYSDLWSIPTIVYPGLRFRIFSSNVLANALLGFNNTKEVSTVVVNSYNSFWVSNG